MQFSLILLRFLAKCPINSSSNLNIDAFQWIGCFHANRKQCVIVDSVSSNFVPVTSCVLQGTVLGMLLSLLPICPSVLPHLLNCLLVYHTIHSPSGAIQLLQDLAQLVLWVNGWWLTLNLHNVSIMHIFYK